MSDELELQRLRDEVRHLRAGIAAYRSVLSLSTDSLPYSIVDNKNLMYIKAWEKVDLARCSSR